MSYKVSLDNIGPLRLNETDRTRSALQNVGIVLSTWKGSVPLFRVFGISREFLHKPVPVAKALLRAEIREAVERFEPRVEVVDVTFAESVDGLIPTVEVNVLE